VEEWLAQLELQSLTVVEEEGGSRRRSEEDLITLPYSLDIKHSRTEESKQPATPVRLREISQSLDEASPTNTSFSSRTIFDSPAIKETGSRDLEGVSDTSATTIEDGEPNWSSGEKLTQEVKEAEEEDIITPSEALSSHSAGSLNSIIPPTESSISLYIPISPTEEQLSLNQSKPRLVWITSCLQCTLAGLPCSRTQPSCSRCKRKGVGDMCLLRRRKLGEEMVRGDGEENKISVLLRVKRLEEDMDEKLWERKVELANELEQEWKAKEERKNWVLPMSGRKGDYWTHGHRNRVQPRWMGLGEGTGRQTFAEVVLG
jgi:hypothetical protein